MTFTMQHHSGKAAPEQAILAAGFEQWGPCTFRNDSLTVRLDGPWLSVQTQAARCKSLGLGNRGLWKRHGDLTIVEIPASVVEDSADIDGHETDATGIEQLLAWCEASLSGGEPAGWTAPTDAELRALAPVSAWSIQAGPQVRQIDLIREDNHVALHLALIPAISGDLSKSRRAWATSLVNFANDRRRLTRLGLGGGAQRTSIIAEVDLTGCPRPWYAALVPLSLAALRHVAAQLLPTLSLLCDPHVHCDAWEQSLS